MQSQKFNLVPGAVSGVQILGDLFVYESGASAGSSALLVKPENGNEIVLKPGQQFRATEKAGRWFIRADDGVSAITGTVIIGEGEFFDSNTTNTFKLDGTFTNTVKVSNTTAERVPVTADITQTIPVSIAGEVQVAGALVNYTNSFSNKAVGTINVIDKYEVFSPAQNVNGAIVEFAEFSLCSASGGGVSATVTLVAKTSVPAWFDDGDVLMIAGSAGSASISNTNVNLILGHRVKIPAGKGLWVAQTSLGTAPIISVKTVLTTLL